MQETNDASLYFDANWKRYQSTLAANSLYHKEMGDALNQFIDAHFKQDFSLVDVGCGDSSTMAPILLNKKIKHYIGIDAAPNVLKLAEKQMAVVTCDQDFICDDMSTAIPKLTMKADIIFTSYAVHHLLHEHKVQFIQNCKNKLNDSGCLVMVDGVLDVNQTREQWLDALEERLNTTQTMTPDELQFRMQHPRADDRPESIETFQRIAQEQGWKQFEVLVNKGIFAFMVFSK
jgi:cyclopropane fatty-acyl-phospholipid synthase-like methyltransferase